MQERDLEFMRAAIEASQKSRIDPSGSVPRVGAVAVVDNEILKVAYREEIEPGQHAEFILLQKHLPEANLVGATVYTTLEPCTERGKTRDGVEKVPCVQRLIKRKVGRVVIGMLDPNPIVRGLGFRMLRDANIAAEVFPHELMSQVEAINQDFIRAMEANPIHRVINEIAVAAVKSNHPLQRPAIVKALNEALYAVKKIQNGQVPIPGREAGYFHRWIEVAERSHEPERVRAYIRIPAFDPDDLLAKNWFKGFYEKLTKLVNAGRLTIHYVFLIGTHQPDTQTIKFLDSFKPFAEEIKIVDKKGEHLSAHLLRPSTVLFQTQRVAFTHDRADNAALIEADEWIFEHNYDAQCRRLNMIEMASSVYFTKTSSTPIE
jgi:pyrimidine deaminase RibD-like protein